MRRPVAALRAARPYDELGRRARSAGARQALRAGGLRRARDHRPLVPQRATLDGARRRDPERRAERRAAGRPGRPRARLRHRGRSRRVRGRAPRPRRDGGVDHRQGGVAYLAHPYWTGALRGRSSCPTRLGNRGLERRLRARGRPWALHRHWDELLDAGGPCFALATDDSHHPGFDSGFAWTWVRAERSRGRARRAAHRRFYGTTGPRSPRRRERRLRRGALRPGQSVTLVSGRLRGAPSTRAGSATARGESSTDADGLITAVRLERPLRAPTGASRSPTLTGTGPGRTRCDTCSVGRRARRARTRPFDLLVIGGGIIGAGIARGCAARPPVALVERGDFAGATSSASSKLVHGGLRYLRIGDVRLVREAHPERRPDERRRAPPGPAAAVPVPALPRRPVPAGDHPGRALDATRRSPATSSAGS